MKLLLLLLAALVVHGELDTCEKQKICRLECSDLEYPTKVYTLEKMTAQVRDLILSRMNGFRNDVALGAKYSEYLPSAANMRMMQWNREYEYYSEGNVRGDSSCTPYEVFARGWQGYHYSSNGVYNLENSLNMALQLVFDMTFKAPDRITWSMTGNIMANNTEIGCAYGTHIDNLENVSLFLRCTTGSGGGTVVKDLYETGEPCSKCNLWNEMCSSGFNGLCTSLPLNN